MQHLHEDTLQTREMERPRVRRTGDFVLCSARAAEHGMDTVVSDVHRCLADCLGDDLTHGEMLDLQLWEEVAQEAKTLAFDRSCSATALHSEEL